MAGREDPLMHFKHYVLLCTANEVVEEKACAAAAAAVTAASGATTDSTGASQQQKLQFVHEGDAILYEACDAAFAVPVGQFATASAVMHEVVWRCC